MDKDIKTDKIISEEEIIEMAKVITKDSKFFDMLVRGRFSFVYFIRCNEFVKIGFSTNNLIKRFEAIQCGNPYKLELEFIMPGGKIEEGELHKKFKHIKKRGEWYILTKKEVEKIVTDYLFNRK